MVSTCSKGSTVLLLNNFLLYYNNYCLAYPCETDFGLPVASIYTSQPNPSDSFLTSLIASHLVGLSVTSAPHLAPIASYREDRRINGIIM